MSKHLLILLLLLPMLANAATPDSTARRVFHGYAGGMMLHLGYQYGQSIGFADAIGDEQTLRSLTYGIGGALKIHLFSHWKVGAEGFVSTMPLRSQGDGSNIRTGWGGILNEAYLTCGKVQPFVGGTIGGGVQRTTHVYSDVAAAAPTFPADFTKRGLFVCDPYIGVDLAATQKLHILLRADWLLAFHHKQMITPTGPRLYLGLMFTH